MDLDDDDDVGLQCEMCGHDIDDPALERGYMFSDDKILCFACAVVRGGSYDDHRDTWVRPPNLSGLYGDGDPDFGLRGATP